MGDVVVADAERSVVLALSEELLRLVPFDQLGAYALALRIIVDNLYHLQEIQKGLVEANCVRRVEIADDGLKVQEV